MADDSPAVFDTATARGILSRLSRLERKQNGLLGGGYNQAFPQGPLVTRWGKTSTTPDYPTYPSSGNVVGVSLGNYEPSPLYPGATAVKTFTAYEPPIYVFATLENGSLPAEGTEVRLTWRNGRWWILQDSTGSSIPTAIMFNGNGYNGDGSSKNQLLYYGVSHASNRGVYIHFLNGWGDFTETGVTMLTTASSVGAGTHAYDASMFKLTKTGLYRFIVRGLLTHDVTLGKTYNTVTGTTTSSAGHTHDFSWQQERLMQCRTFCRMNWRNTGGGAWQTTPERMNNLGGETHYLHSINLANVGAHYMQFECVFFQMVDAVNREYRLGFTMEAAWDGLTPAFDHGRYTFDADSGLIAVTRLGDYAADQTLAY